MKLEFKTVCQTQKDAIKWRSKTGFTETHYFGGLGCGKTVAGGLSLLLHAQTPNTPCLVVRRTLKTLKASTLRAWLKPELPILHRGMIKHHDKETGHFDLINGSYIDSIGATNIDDVLTREYAFIFIDELPQISKEQYLTLQGRLRHPHPLGQKLMAAYNPCSMHSWVYEHLQAGKDRKYFRAFKGMTSENKALPKQYQETLEQAFSERQKEMLLRGNFMPEYDLIFFAFSPRNVCQFPQGKIVRDAIIWQDYGGGTGDSALLLAWLFHDQSAHISDCIIRDKQTHGDIKNSMTNLWKKTGYHERRPQVVYDVANAALGREMRRWGWDVFGADKNVEAGINQVNDLLAQGRVTISPSCSGLINALETLGREDLARKKNGAKRWDAPDAMRYGIMHLTSDNGIAIG